MLTTQDKIKKIINQNQDLFMQLEDLDKTGKLRKLKYKKRVNFTLDEGLVQEFRNYCKRQEVEMSPQVELLIKAFLARSKKK